ncbi:MAG TPA: TonB-dependent receptor [Chitinophagaceae bacterium]|nr:TonB-dependent receptor [Chitinophagaceae bacterium]
MRKLLLLWVGCLLLSAQLLAQDRTITGKVTDDKGSPVQNASVVIKGSTTGTTTDVNGDFSLRVPASARAIVISSVGMAQQEIALGNRTTFSVTLRVDERDMQEVVVVGYQQRRKRDEAGAISSVRGDDIENLPNPSLDKALQGRAAGVVVQANNGIPGGAINVRIRGTGSFLAGNQPLYIVDGVQMNTRDDASFTQSNPLAFLNPNDIESIDILKDAASAAIYGAQASNGVVIITTKKGKAGKTKFQFNTYAGIAQPLRMLDILNAQEYAQLRVEAYMNSGPTVTPIVAKRSFLLNEVRITTPATITDKQLDSIIAGLPTYDWQDAAFQNGLIQNYELSASGGNDRTTFRLSASYNLQEAVVTKADFKRGTVKFDLSNKATDRLTINTSLNLSNFQQNLPFAVEGSFLGSPAFAASTQLPTSPIYNPDGTFAGIPPNNLPGILNQNVIAVAEFNTGYQRTNQAVGNISLDYKLRPWLTFRSFFGLDYRLVQGKLFRDPRTPDAFVRKGLGQVQSNWNTNILTTQTLNFNHSFAEKHRLDGLVGFEYRSENNEGISASGDGFPTFQFTTLNTAANPVGVGEFWTGFRRMGVFGTVNYNFDSRFIVSGILRYDGSSRFGADNRFGVFPSIKLAWNISNEQFLANQNWLNNLKLRLSWGRTGNDQIGNFDALGLYSGGLVYNNSGGITFSQLANPSLKWEKNQTTNVGIDFGILNNRINGSVELYQKLTKDLLLTQQVQWTTGFSGFTQNVGSIENKGIEVTLGGTLLKSRARDGFNWNVNFVFAYNDNRVKSLYNGLQEIPGDPATRVGRRLGSIFTQKYAGVNPATGRPMWYDTLGNLTYQVQARDRVYIGDQQPEYSGGLSNTLTFKGFTLDVFFQYEYGRLAQDQQVNFLTENISRLNAVQDVFDKRWTTPGQLTAFPRQNSVGTEAKGSGALSGSRTWFKADYIRLKNVTLSYDVPTSISGRLRLSNARLYVQATNIWTHSDWYGYDVEFLGSGTGIIPQSKNVTVGLQLGF